MRPVSRSLSAPSHHSIGIVTQAPESFSHGRERQTPARFNVDVAKALGMTEKQVSRALIDIYNKLQAVVKGVLIEEPPPAEKLAAPVTKPKRQRPGSPPKGMQ